MPSGTDTTTAIPTSMTVPTRAARMPPWFSGAVGLTPAMSWMKKFTWTRACHPLTNVKTMVLPSARSTTEAASQTVTVTSRSTTMWRGLEMDTTVA